MLVALGMDTSVRPLHSWNAYSPMLVALGKDTLVRLLQFWNAWSPILKTSLSKLPDIDLSTIEAKTPISDYLSIYIM